MNLGFSPLLLITRNRRSPALSFLFGILLLGGSSFLVWNVFYTSSDVSKSTLIDIPEGASVAVRLADSSNFIENSGVKKLLEGEAIQARQGRVTLIFFDNTRVTLDENSEVTLKTVRGNEDDRSENISLELTKGRMWASVPRKINPKSQVALESGEVAVKIRGGEVSFEKNRISVAEGGARLSIGDTTTEELEVGQEILLTDEDIAQASTENTSLSKTLLSADFQNSEWFRSNIAPQKIVVSDDIQQDVSSEEAIPENSDTSLSVGPEPPAIQVTAPGGNGEEIVVSDPASVIRGTVPEGTEKVIVNDYELSKFSLGDREFLYNAAVQWGTMKEGRNEYTIVALGSDGERNEAKITLIYGEDTSFDSQQEDSKEGDGTSHVSEGPVALPEENSSIQGLVIDFPKSGEEVDENPIDVLGKAPKGAAKIVVDDYPLSKFILGNTTWSYRMSDVFGNRPEGEKTVLVEAFDESGTKIASTKVTFTILPPKEPPTSSPQGVSGSSNTSVSDNTESQKNWAEIRGGTLPPVPQDKNEPSI